MSALRRAHLSVTPLENRETPAVMTYAPGSFFGNNGDVNLYIQFSANNSITWTTAPPTTPAAFATGASTLGGNLNITLLGGGTNTAGTVSNVGNIVDVNLGGHALSGNLTITTGNFDDTVNVYNGTVNGNVTIKTNGGADNIRIDDALASAGTSIGKNLSITAAAGADTVEFAGPLMTVGGSATVNMGPGNNTYNLANKFAIAGNLQMQAGAGNDPINQLGTVGSTIGGNANFVPGGGANSLLLPAGLSINGNVTYIGGTGSDNVFDDAKINGNLLCLMGAGSDVFIYGTVPFVGGNAKLFGGPPLTDVYIQLSTPTWTNTVLQFP